MILFIRDQLYWQKAGGGVLTWVALDEIVAQRFREVFEQQQLPAKLSLVRRRRQRGGDAQRGGDEDGDKHLTGVQHAWNMSDVIFFT